MKMYFAGGDSKQMIDFLYANGAKRILGSYLSFRTKKTEEIIKQTEGKDFFLDSGAFSAYTRDIEIDIDELITFIHKHKKCFKVYANLDIIGDYKKSLENLLYMESKGLNPLPVFHFKEPEKMLVDMVNKYDYIALGGTVGVGKPYKKIFWDRCWKIIYENTLKKGKKLTKVHGFGLNAFYALQRYPFYSVDATNWLLGGKFRRLIKFKDGKSFVVGKDTKQLNKDTVRLFEAEYPELNGSNIKEVLKIEKYITDLWKARGVKWD